MPEDFTHTLCGIGLDSSDSSQHSDHSDCDDSISDLKELQEWCRVMHEPPPDACAPQLHAALGAAQIAYSKLHVEMKKLQTDYNSLLSSIPQNRKRTVENNLNVILDNNIATLAKKDCFCYHFWVPKDLFLLTTLSPGYDLNNPACWSMPESKLSGLKAELYFMVPNDLRVHVTSYSNFSHVFSNAVRAERPNILKPVVKALLKMHGGNAGTHYTPLSPLLFPKPDAPVAQDLFKTQLLVNLTHPKYFSKIIWVMVFGKGVLAGK
ncbi:hypothetical protein F5141DRAFT_1065742 [Pisolithus sp. B1]|nr:hypothetical protein F5141DRAFT_1065742 [Pisolithus sp. B1]